MKIPFVGEYVPRESLDEATKFRHTAEAQLDILRKDLAVAKRAIDKVLPKLMKITLYDADIEFHTTRICVDIRQEAIDMAFMRGDSDREIRFFARILAEAVERKIMKYNILRKEGI